MPLTDPIALPDAPPPASVMTLTLCSTQKVAPGEYDVDPVGQRKHLASVAAPIEFENVPAGQRVQLTESTALEYEPALQGGHELFEPTKDPGVQVREMTRIRLLSRSTM